jgi:hypothetical protein
MRARLAGRAALFFLDAHWCVAEGTAGQHSQCPLLEEIGAIGALSPDSVILIDDARLFLAPPPPPHEVTQWPSFDQVDAALRAASTEHELMVVNDVIAFYPRRLHGVMKAYAHAHGIDWLRAAQSLSENEDLRRTTRELDEQLKGKEAVIRDLKGAVEAADARTLEVRQALDQAGDAQVWFRQLEKKEEVIIEQRRALEAYRATFAVLGFVIVPANHLVLGMRSVMRRLFAPRLGILQQYPPRPLALPAHYSLTAPPAQPPRITIVTPSFRQAAFIERTILSVLGQDYPNVEYIVQDGGSEDGTRAILQRYAPRLASWESRRDNGQAEAINRGFDRSTGEIMAWLNSDDILLPGALAYVAEYFRTHPRVDVIYGHRLCIDEADRHIGRWLMPPHDDRVLSWADFVPQETLFWRRRIWDKAGGRVDESFRFAMDWDLLLRFRDAGARFARVPRFLGGFRIHQQQKTSAAINEVGFDEMNRLRQRVLGRVPTSAEVRRAVAPYLASHVARDLAWRIRHQLGMAW